MASDMPGYKLPGLLRTPDFGEGAEVSVIIPVYNLEKYIEACVQSVITQNYPGVEIIIIDDGSTDATLDVIYQAAKNNSSIKVLSTSNGGQSVARNIGLSLASGKYVLFLDGDDYLEPNSLSRLVSEIETRDVDAVFFSASTVLDGIPAASKGDFSYKRPHGVEGKAVSGHYFFQKSIREKAYTVSPCLYLFKRESLGALRFHPNIIHEDNLFTTAYLLSSGRKVTSIQAELYCRRLRPGSTMTELKQERHVQGYLTVAEELAVLRKAGVVCEKELSGFIQSMLTGAINTCAAIPKYGFPRSVRQKVFAVLIGTKIHHLKVPHVLCCLIPELALLKIRIKAIRRWAGK